MSDAGIAAVRWLSDQASSAMKAQRRPGLYVLSMLHALDTQRLRRASFAMFGAARMSEERLSREQWRTLLAEMGATTQEVRDVLDYLGFPPRATFALGSGAIAGFD